MFMCDVRLSLVVMAGIPLFLIIVLVIKPAQRRAWQDVSNKSSNLNAYLHESLDGMKITQAFTREEENAKIYNNLNTKMYKSWMKAQYTSNLVWFSVNNISTWVVGAMYLVGFSLLGPAVQIGTLIAISAYAWRFWQPILQLSNLYNTFINAVAYLERIFEMIDEPVLVDDAPDATELPPIKGDVTFDDVTFSYDGSMQRSGALQSRCESGRGPSRLSVPRVPAKRRSSTSSRVSTTSIPAECSSTGTISPR